MRYGTIPQGDAMRAPILPCHRVPSRNSDPGRPIRLSQNYRGGNLTVSGTTGRFGFNLPLQFDFGTIDGIKSRVSNFFGLRSDTKHASDSKHTSDSKHAKLSSYSIDPAAAYKKPNGQSTLRASAGLESSDVYTPLKSVAGGLCAILKYYDVRYAHLYKPFTQLTFAPASDSEPWNNRIPNTQGRRPGWITQCTRSRGRDR